MAEKLKPKSVFSLGIDNEPSDEDKALDLAIESLGEGGGKCLVKRKRMGDSAFQYLATYEPVATVTLETLKKEWGGGQYRLEFRKADGSFHKSVNVSISEEFKGAIETKAAMNAANGGLNPVELIREMRGNDSSLPLILAMMKQQSEAQAQMTQVLVAAMTGQRAAAPALPDIILAKMMEQSDPMKQLLLLSEMKKVFGNGEVKEDAEPSSLGERLLNMAPSVLSILAGGGQGGMPGQRALPSAVAAVPPAVSPPPATAHSGQLPPAMKTMLINAAQRNADIGLYVDLLLDNIGSDENIFMVQDILKQPGGLQSLLGSVPKETQQWFVNLGQMLLEYKPTDEPAIDKPNENSVVSNP